MTRIGRKNVAWLCLSAMLYLQFALAAYACPTETDSATPTFATVAAAQQPCQGMDQERPKLCEQHCSQISQSVDTQPHSSINAPVLPLMAVIARPDLHVPI